MENSTLKYITDKLKILVSNSSNDLKILEHWATEDAYHFLIFGEEKESISWGNMVFNSDSPYLREDEFVMVSYKLKTSYWLAIHDSTDTKKVSIIGFMFPGYAKDFICAVNRFKEIKSNSHLEQGALKPIDGEVDDSTQ